ncbi:MAG: hypothetical protein JWM93_376 [Frankiales bacterium]|nr:hypothetical protein [Frankiales bacterium]
MSDVRNPWARHFQHVWHERAGDPRLPLWLRVSALAYGRHTANGHATFRAGDVRLVLGKVDTDGVIAQPSSKEVHRAIGTAMQYGYLGSESSVRCLVVPPHAIAGGLGDELSPCSEHDRRRRGSSRHGHLRRLSA